jgi:hypothetical protein
MAKQKVQKDVAASDARGKKKPRDYGDAPVTTSAPEGFEKSSGGRHLTFSKFGDCISGTFTKLEESTGKGKSDILHFVDENGAKLTAFASAQIRQHIEQNDIVEGDKFHLTFVNVVTGRGGRPFKLYDFYFKHADRKREPAAKPTKKGKR